MIYSGGSEPIKGEDVPINIKFILVGCALIPLFGICFWYFILQNNEWIRGLSCTNINFLDWMPIVERYCTDLENHGYAERAIKSSLYIGGMNWLTIILFLIWGISIIKGLGKEEICIYERVLRGNVSLYITPLCIGLLICCMTLIFLGANLDYGEEMGRHYSRLYSNYSYLFLHTFHLVLGFFIIPMIAFLYLDYIVRSVLEIISPLFLHPSLGQ